MAPKKIKILLVGPVKGQYQILIDKLNSLQRSKAGPFDTCFCVGPFFTEEDNDNNNNEQLQQLTFPLPVYIQHYSGMISKKKLHSLFTPPTTTTDIDDSTKTTTNNNNDTTKMMIPLAHNLWYLRRNQTTTTDDDTTTTTIWKISLSNHSQPLLVATASPSHSMNQNNSNNNNNNNNGCDLLLTDDWPQGMEDLGKQQQQQQEGTTIITTTTSYDIAQVALSCKPRYHITPSIIKINNQYQYYASPPYQIPNLNQPARFIALGPIIQGKTSKKNKYIHALGLVPILLEEENNIQQQDTASLSCPFPIDNNISSGGRDSPPLPPPSSKPPPPPPLPSSTAMMGGGTFYSRFAPAGSRNNNNKRGRNDNNNNNTNILEPPENDPTCSTLFLYGLHKDVSGDLQSTSSSTLLQVFSKYKVQKVRHPSSATTSTFCFLEFQTQNDAIICLKDCCEDNNNNNNQNAGRIHINGVSLTLKWATNNQNNKRAKNEQTSQQQQQEQQQPRRHYHVTHTEAGARHSTTLYFHPPNNNNNNDTGNNTNNNDNNDDNNPTTTTAAVTTTMDEKFVNELRDFVERTLEDSLNDDNVAEEDRVTAKTEPALAVQVRSKDKYGFLEFASHAAATMTLVALTTSTDGGKIINQQQQEQQQKEQSSTLIPKHLIGTILRWAKGVESKKKDAIHRHFPPDTRTDCWFCLASPTCESHLITGVYDSWYATMPKGPLHKGHILLVPITHTSQGALTNTIVKNNILTEFISLKKKLIQHAYNVYNMDMFLFERAIETKGGYHTHVQCVPIAKGIKMQLENKLLSSAKEIGFNLHKLSSSSIDNENNKDWKGESDDEEGMKIIKELITNPDDKYFYAEIISISTNTTTSTKKEKSEQEDEDENENENKQDAANENNNNNNNETGSSSSSSNYYDISRFLYHHTNSLLKNDNDTSPNNNNNNRVPPLQFAREVLASVLNEPNLAHWKSCVVDKDKETEMTTEFRKSFAQFE